MENHHVSWENPLFLWSFSIAMLNYQRVPLFYVSVISQNGEVRTPTKRKIRPTKKQGLTGYVPISETMYTVYNAKPAKVLGCVVFMLFFFGGQSKSNHWTPWSLNRFGVTGMGNNSNVFFCKREGADRPRERWREIQHGCNLVANIVWQTVSPVTCGFVWK